MARLETMPPEVHFQIFSYLSTATFGPKLKRWFSVHEWRNSHKAWNEIGTHPLQYLYASSRTLRNAVESYCEHRLQHLLTIRPLGKGPEAPFPLPYCIYYLKYMARRCTFCYERVKEGYHGTVDFSIPACVRCQGKFPYSRKIRWDRVERKYELPLEELKENCTWAPIEETIFSDEPDYDPGLEQTRYRYGGMHQTRKTYLFDERDIQRYIERRYGGLDTFFAALEKKRWDKKLELERMEKQRRWAREEIERRIAAGEPMVKRFIAEHKEMEKEREEEREDMVIELKTRIERHAEVFHGWLTTFLNETADPEGGRDETPDWERLEDEAESTADELIDWEHKIRNYIEAEERVARNIMIERFRLYMKKQVTADVLLKYGLDSLEDPMQPKKPLRRYGDCFY
jgi:hypothetical protein